MLTKRQKTKLEKAIIWEKRLVEKEVEQLILSCATDLVQFQLDAAEQGNTQAGQYLLDRAFGKAKQSVDVHQIQPVLIMPATLVEKFSLSTTSLPSDIVDRPPTYEILDTIIPQEYAQQG